MLVVKDWLESLREQYPQGSRIKLIEMRNDPRPIPPGSTGTLDHIDDSGQFHVKWDNGQSQALDIGEACFFIQSLGPSILKLYMPLTAEYIEPDSWDDDMLNDGCILDGCDLLPYEESIRAAMVDNRLDEEAERGIMHWYDKNDSVNEKVRSVVFTVEEREERLWGVAECQVMEQLSPKELSALKAYIHGQVSDGWGEGFEQREIRVDGRELCVHLGDINFRWEILTEEQFGNIPIDVNGLPDACFTTLKSTGQLVCIKFGDSGYYPSDWDTGEKERNRALADGLNRALGVTRAQRLAMESCVMFGWAIPSTAPPNYETPEEERTEGFRLE